MGYQPKANRTEMIEYDDMRKSNHYQKRIRDHHLLLWNVCKDKEAYQNGTDTDNHNKPDCSCGCKFHHMLAGINGMDWGVCCCLESPRAGLLTFEHMGCDCWTRDGNY